MKIGFIGLGIMGKPMAKNLLKAGHQVVVRRHRGGWRTTLAERGRRRGLVADRRSPLRSTSSSRWCRTRPEVEQACSAPTASSKAPRRASSRRHELDRPMVVAESRRGPRGQGRRVPRRAGQRRRAEGDRRHAGDHGRRRRGRSTRWSPSSTMGATVVYVGKIGAGNVTKLANQIIVAVNIAAMGEALALAQRPASPGGGVQRGQGRPGRQHRAEREGADGAGPQLQARASASVCTSRTWATRSTPPTTSRRHLPLTAPCWR